jgi:hypothetical protein
LKNSEKSKLPGVNIDIKLPKNVQLRYDGEVPDLLGHIALTELQLKGIITEYRGILDKLINKPFDYFQLSEAKSVLEKKIGSFHDVQAYCFEHNPPDSDKMFVIAKKTGLEKNMSIFADGHESGEFLQKNGLQKILQEALFAEGLDIKVDQYTDEDFADLGGFLALFKAKKSGDKVFIPTFKINPDGRETIGRMFGLEQMDK